MRLLAANLLLLAALLCGTAQAEVAVPPLQHRVTDLTGTLDAPQMQALESKLAAFESEKGAQIAVLLLPTTQPETIEQFGIRLAEQWKIGREGIDDGAILIVARDERKMRIEVGYGLEGALNDATARRIIEETIKPFFKNGDFYGGIEAGTNAMMQTIGGELLPEPQADSSDEQDPVPLVVLGVILLVVLAKTFVAALLGGVAGGLVWLFFGMPAGIVAGVGVFFLALLLGLGRGMRSGLRRSRRSDTRDWGSGGWSSGGWSSSSGGSNDSFGGGGGDFGGGGASGDW